jgi:NhaC family Na+:H+ antiporter
MPIFIALIISFLLLFVSVIHGYFIAYPLFLCLCLISAALIHQGFSPKTIVRMAIFGSRQSWPVIKILLLIGAVTAVWMAAGTVPALVYYGIQFISPHGFIVTAFGLTSLVSLLLGTSFGTASTIGVALMMMAKGSDVNPHLIAGAIIAGAYVGDRSSPMSSSAHLVAIITRTNLYTNLRNMIATGILPFGISLVLYWLLSWAHPVTLSQSELPQELDRLFQLHWLVLLPAFTLLVLAVARVQTTIAMLSSLAVAAIVAVQIQQISLGQVVQFAIVGFSLSEDTPVRSILVGGGMLAMAKVCLVVILSTAMAGMLSGTRSLQAITRWLQPLQSPSSLFLGTTVVGSAAAAFGCTQTIAILLTQQLVQPNYRNNHQLALDLENTVVVLAPLIPWNIAGLVPATALLTNWGFIPYAFYLYLLPILTFVQLRQGQSPIERRLKTR